MKYLKKYTVKEWKKLCKTIYSAENVGNQIQFFNFTTQKLESYDYLTAAEVILHRYKVVLLDHKTRHDNKFVITPIKEIIKDGLKTLPGKLTQKNFDKGMKVFDESMQGLTKSLDQLGDGLGGKKDNKSKMEKLWGKPKSNNNMEKIWGTSKPKPKDLNIWSKPVQKRKKKRKSQSDKWDKHEANLTKIWGKKK